MFIMQKFHLEPCTMLLVLLVGDIVNFSRYESLAKPLSYTHTERQWQEPMIVDGDAWKSIPDPFPSVTIDQHWLLPLTPGVGTPLNHAIRFHFRLGRKLSTILDVLEIYWRFHKMVPWDVRAWGWEISWEQCFRILTASECKKFKWNSIIAVEVRVSPPSIRVLTT